MTTTPQEPSRRAAMIEALLLLVAIAAGAVTGVKAFGGGLEPAKIAVAAPTSAPTDGGTTPEPSFTPVDTFPAFPSGRC